MSLIQSNARGFGCHVVVPGTGIFLHNRGIGFSSRTGHPAEYGPGRRPPHTLSPALVTRPDGSLRAVLGTMGGDSQPQVLLQLLARLLRHGESPGRPSAPPAGCSAADGGTGFDTWAGDGPDPRASSRRTPPRRGPTGWRAAATTSSSRPARRRTASATPTSWPPRPDGWAGASDMRSEVGDAIGY